jgi:hypothetical protein
VQSRLDGLSFNHWLFSLHLHDNPSCSRPVVKIDKDDLLPGAE